MSMFWVRDEWGEEKDNDIIRLFLSVIFYFFFFFVSQSLIYIIYVCVTCVFVYAKVKAD